MGQNILIFLKDNIFSVMTAVVATIALWQTHKQIKISNKQFLFENRLNKITLVRSLIYLYEENKNLLDYSNTKDDEPIIVDFQFENLTNIGYLKDVTEIINKPKNNEEKTNFLLKLEELKQFANEIKFLFKMKQSVLLKEFIDNYQNVLLELYKYQIIQDTMKEKNTPSLIPKTYIEKQKEFRENSHRARLFIMIDKLEHSYQEIQNKNVIKNIEKEIKL